MSNTKFMVTVTTDVTPSGLARQLAIVDGLANIDSIEHTGKFISNPLTSKHVSINSGAVTASGYVSFSSFAAGNTVTVANQVLTGMTANPSGVPTQFKVGTNDYAAASGLTNLINTTGVATPSGVVTAVQDAKNINVFSAVPGAIGNIVSLAISANGSVSGSYLTTGAEGTKADINYGL